MLLPVPILILLISGCTGFIVPNEIPTVLSLVYSNIPPLKIGQDTRFGIGFRLGPHADFQTLIELGPQTNTAKLVDEEGQSKRQLPQNIKIPIPDNTQKAEPAASQNIAVLSPEKEVTEKKQKKPNKKYKPKPAYMGNIQFTKVPGIDFR